MRKYVHDKLHELAHTHTFHTSHGVAHVAYFVAVMAEGHGMYAVIGGVMVVFSFITVYCGDEFE